MRILVVKSSSMGDIVHALPTARDIAEHFPGAVIDWVAEESFKDIPRLSPHVGDVIVTAFRRWRKSHLSRSTWGEVASVRHRLKSTRYDIVIDLQGLARSGLVVHWTGCPRRAGYSFDTVRERFAALSYTPELRFALSADLGAVARCRALAAAALGYKVEGRPRFGLVTTVPDPLPGLARFAALIVNTSRDRKLWPEERWVETGLYLKGRGVASVLFWGGEAERDRAERIAAGIPGSVVAPRMSLAKTAAVLAKAEISAGVDTGLTHLAAAVGVPTLGIFTDTRLGRVTIVGEGECRTIGGLHADIPVSSVVDWCKEVLS